MAICIRGGVVYKRHHFQANQLCKKCGAKRKPHIRKVKVSQ